MAIYYADYEGGNDASAGTSYATRWKTMTLGATAAHIAAGDVIRVMASPAPVDTGITATFTSGSRSITLTSGVTKNIDMCESAWTPSVNVTQTNPASRKEGTFSQRFTIATAFTTGKVAFKALGSIVDFSAYQQVSFWVRIAGATTAVTFPSTMFSLRLCSDTIGAVTVNTIPVKIITVNGDEGFSTLGYWVPVTIDNGVALGNSIQSVAIYADSDPSATQNVTFDIDCIFASKAPASPDAITLQSLIGKNTAGETFIGIASINGTTLVLNGGPLTETLSNYTSQGYTGSSGTVELWRRETIKLPYAATQTTSTGITETTKSGTDGLPITYSFGWNRTDMSTQSAGTDGETWFDLVAGQGTGLLITHNFINMERVAMVRAGYGLCATGGSGGLGGMGILNFIASNNNQVAGFDFGLSQSIPPSTITIDHADYNGSNADGTGFGVIGIKCGPSKITVSNINSNFRTFEFGDHAQVYLTTVANNAAGALSQGDCSIYNAVFSGTGSVGVNDIEQRSNLSGPTSSFSDFINCTFESSGNRFLTNAQAQYQNVWFRSFNEVGQPDGYEYWFSDGATIVKDTVNVHTPGNEAYALSPTTAIRTNNYPVSMVLDHGKKMHVISGTTYTRKVWVNRSNTGITARLIIKGGQVAGVPNDVVATAGADAGTWELLSLTPITPSATGDIEVRVEAYGGTTLTAYFDDTETSPNLNPGIANVVNGINYNINGIAHTGTCYSPAASDVRFGVNVAAATGTCKVPTAANTKIGTAVDVSGTGTYDGSDRWSNLGETSVVVGLPYKANSTVNNKTGTLDLSGSGIASAVWEEKLSDHTDGTTFGGLMNAIKTLLGL